jgi:hypothetical protein
MSSKSSSKGKKIFKSIEFTPAKGGAISEARYQVNRGGQGGGPMYDYDTVRSIHPTKEDAAKCLTDTLMKHFGESEAEDDGYPDAD